VAPDLSRIHKTLTDSDEIHVHGGRKSPSADGGSGQQVLKRTLLAVALLTFSLFAWATVASYQAAPPQPDRFVAANGGTLMTGDDILAGKAGFQKADLMDTTFTGPGGRACGCPSAACSRLSTTAGWYRGFC
jgi:hypothetical protein